MPASAIGARAGQISFTIQTNVILSLAGSPCGLNCPNSGNLKGLVPECGDNLPGNVTVDWTGNGSMADDTMLQATTATPFKIHVGNMAGCVFVDSVFDWDGIPAEENKYARAGGRSSDVRRRQQQRHPGQQGADAAGKAEDTVGADPADPWANANGAARRTSPGAPEDQKTTTTTACERRREDAGLLPLVRSRSRDQVEQPHAGIAEALGTAAAPTSVTSCLQDIPSIGSDGDDLGEPFAPGDAVVRGTCAVHLDRRSQRDD
jgi:hypothetical protein